MSIIQYRKTPVYHNSPLAQLSELHREMNRLFDGSIFSDGLTGWAPALDVTQDKEQVQVVVELPGLKKEDISLSFQDGVLTISGERKDTTEQKDGETHRSERFFGRFERSVELPVEVNPDRINATYQNGLLTVTLAKAEEAKPKQININVS
ncbi:MAG: Hsp20/alpha crystallin family protein [Chthoniobacterales bacterium]